MYNKNKLLLLVIISSNLLADNRSNQMNPNNSAYSSSRGISKNTTSSRGIVQNKVNRTSFVSTQVLSGPQCKEGGNQMEITQCASEVFQKVDKELNTVYQELRKIKKKDKHFLSNLKKAQRAWLIYRDAAVDAYFTCENNDVTSYFGSMYSLMYISLKTELTEQRIKILKEQLANVKWHLG